MRRAIAAAALALWFPAAAWGQSHEFNPELSAGVGLGHAFRFEDRSYGNRLNVSVGVAIAHRSGLAVELEGNRTQALDPPETPCGIVGVTCVGSGHDGPLGASSASATVHYRFGRGRLRPYVLAGLGAMWSAWLHSKTQIVGDRATITETASRDVSVGPDLGAGVRFQLSKAVSINPEFRWLEGSWGGRESLSVMRLTLRTAYAW